MNSIAVTPLLYVLAAILVSSFDAAEYQHLGCYADRESPSLRDIQGQDITYGTLKLSTCLSECRKKGYPYAGLQQGMKCYCGDTFGQWGTRILPPLSYSACNWTCDSNIQCGGYLFNNVYYTGRVDREYTSKLVVVYHDTPKIHVEARRQCIQNGGDLAMMNTTQQIQNITATAKNAGKTTGNVWFGLRNRWWNSSLTYEWTDPTMPTFKIDVNYQAFIKDNAIVDPCMTVLPQYDQWKSAQCDQAYPFVCRQLPPEDLQTTAAPTIGSSEEGGVSSANLLSLYIVLPIFGLCYGGSCILYCTYKLYKSFKRKKRDQMLLSNMETLPTEYEPHNKPSKPAQTRPLSAGKAKVYPAPQPVIGPPPRGTGGPPPPLQPLRGAPPRPPTQNRPIPTPSSAGSLVRQSRPTTSGGIELDLDSENPRPETGDERPKTRAEKKREKLLENAANEARERRRGQSAEPPPPTAGSAKSKSRGDSRTGKMDADQAADSGDSSTNLLTDSRASPPSTGSSRASKEPSMLSIQEILKMKVAAQVK